MVATRSQPVGAQERRRQLNHQRGHPSDLSLYEASLLHPVGPSFRYRDCGVQVEDGSLAMRSLGAARDARDLRYTQGSNESL